MGKRVEAMKKVMLAAAKARNPILLRGRHGIGKSEVTYQFAEEFFGYPVVERRASQMLEGDLLGLPERQRVNRKTGEIVATTETISSNEEFQNVTAFCPPDWLYQACREPVVLFMDEIGRASEMIRQGLFQLMDSRSLFGWTLHPDTVICAADNGMENDNSYKVSAFDPAELSRYTVIDFHIPVEEWLEWGAGKMHNQIIDFLGQHPYHIEGGNLHEPNKVLPSRRSWTRFSNTLGDIKTRLEADDFLLESATAYVGAEAAAKFFEYVNTLKTVTIHDILNDSSAIKVVKMENELNTLLELVSQFQTHYANAELSSSQVGNLAGLFMILEDEMKITLAQHIKNAKTRELFFEHKVDGESLLNILHVATLYRRDLKESKEPEAKA